MKRVLGALGVLLLTALGVTVLSAPASNAAPPGAVVVPSGCLGDNWYVNSDEADRTPVGIGYGLLFQPADLVHHAAGFPLEDLTVGGSFNAFPAPDENFRFSVEIINDTPIDGQSGYATLHWTGSAWFIGGADGSLGQYTAHEVDPENFIGKKGRFGIINSDSRVVSFGIGYTKNPPGSNSTVVSSMTFRGIAYNLQCKVTPVLPTAVAPTASCVEDEPVVTNGAINLPLVPGVQYDVQGDEAVNWLTEDTVPVPAGATVRIWVSPAPGWVFNQVPSGLILGLEGKEKGRWFFEYTGPTPVEPECEVEPDPTTPAPTEPGEEEPTPTTTLSTEPSTSGTVTATGTSTTSPVAGAGRLPTTGPGDSIVPKMLVIGGGMITAGAAVLIAMAVRRRRQEA